jgi:membrane-associated phospholipid phosphatase
MLGIVINGEKADPDKIKTLIKLILIFTIGFFIAHYLNCMIERPSYSLLISEGNPAGFMKWYQIPKGSKLLMSLNDLISSHQGSFVSSHVLYAVLFIVIFPAYSLAIPSLKKYGRHLMVIAGILSVSVIICRMITGNNYLTDISFAAFYSLKFCISYDGFKKPKRRISKSIFKKFRD